MADEKVIEIFSDGAGQTRFSGGVVRVDVVSATKAYDDRGKGAVPEVTHRLILSPEGFIRSLNAFQKLMQEMLKAGVITQKQAEEPSSTVVKPEESGAGKGKN